MIAVAFVIGGLGTSVPLAYYLGIMRRLGLLGIW